METEQGGSPEAGDDNLLQKLQRMRERFGDQPTLLTHLDKTVDALTNIEHSEGTDADSSGKTD